MGELILDFKWVERLPEIIREAVKLDHFFQAKGCWSEESLRFTLRVIQGLRDSGHWKTLVEEIATVLGLSSELVQGRLFRAAEEMGRPLEQLRDPALADFCRTLLNSPG